MRLPFLVLIVLLAGYCLGQSDKKRSLFLTMKPQITVLVTEHPTGAEDVVVNAVPGDYPPLLLRSQIEKLGQLLGTPPRWLYFQDKPGAVGAGFSVNGLIDREKKVFRLQPIVRAFAGAPAPHTVDGLQITFANELGSKDDLAQYTRPDALELEVMRMFSPDMLEYRVHLLSQNPADIVIPEKTEPKTETTTTVTGEPSRGLFYVLLVVAGLAAGVLVYLALLRFLPRRADS